MGTDEDWDLTEGQRQSPSLGLGVAMPAPPVQRPLGQGSPRDGQRQLNEDTGPSRDWM